MTLQEVQQTEWYLSRPEIIKKAINNYPPIQLYKIKDSGKQCKIYSYEEPFSGLYDEVTVTVEKTGVGGPLAEMGLGIIDTFTRVFGVSLKSLEPWINDETPLG